MKRLISPLMIVFVSAISFHSSAQQIDSMMSVYAEGFPKERVHVHFDKNIYNKEETIWYKIYVMDPEGPTFLSKNVYVEWYDTTGKVMRQAVSPLFQATARGSFELPATYNGNFVRMKVFTKWMLNDEPEFIYQKDITINTGAVYDAKKEVVPLTRVDVFAEGGTLVNGIESKMAFKATNQFGFPVKIKGLLVNDKNKVIDTIRVRHDGMGSFQVFPKPGESYSIKWSDPFGKSGVTPLPAAKQDGATISVSTDNEFATVRVERTKNAPETFRNMYLLVHMSQNLQFKVSLNATEKTLLNAKIPIAEMPTGVLQFSLFGSDWMPIAERIVFINNRTHEFTAKIIPQLTTLTKRGKNVFDVFVSDTTFTNMSVSVTDASFDATSGASIYSDMLLSNELRGRIHNPGYYLSSDSDSVMANLDLVMQTNGWRKFDWDKLRAGIAPTLKYGVETGMMNIGGKVFGLKNVSTASLMLNLIVQHKDSSRNLLFVPVDKDGTFNDFTQMFYDTARIFYNFNQNKTLTDIVQVKFENGLLRQGYKTVDYTNGNEPFVWNDSLSRIRMNGFLQLQEEWKKRSQYKTLQEVIVKARVKSKEQVLDERYSSGLFAGGDAQTFDFVNDPAAAGALDILSYLQGRVPGLMISGQGTGMSLSWRGSTPDLYLDQFPLGVQQIQSLNVRDIAMVKVFRPPFFGSSGGGAGGAIAIYTKKGGDFKGDNNGSNKGMMNTILTGYSQFKEFYNPQYDNPNENPETDIRTTLYWNPYVMTNKKSPRFRIQFFNNDFSKKLQVVLEGISADGRMTRIVKPLEQPQ